MPVGLAIATERQGGPSRPDQRRPGDLAVTRLDADPEGLGEALRRPVRVPDEHGDLAGDAQRRHDMGLVVDPPGAVEAPFHEHLRGRGVTEQQPVVPRDHQRPRHRRHVPEGAGDAQRFL